MMRALTITQPWAGLVASGIKLVENRARKMAPRDLFGQRFAIHAGRAIDRDAWTSIITIDPTLALDHPGPMARAAGWQRLAGTTSAVIAVATLDSCLDPLACGIDPDSADARAALPADQRRWFFGPIGYVLRDVLALAEAVPCRGWQGFWTLPGDVERRVMEQL